MAGPCRWIRHKPTRLPPPRSGRLLIPPNLRPLGLRLKTWFLQGKKFHLCPDRIVAFIINRAVSVRAVEGDGRRSERHPGGEGSGTWTILSTTLMTGTSTMRSTSTRRSTGTVT